MTYVFNNAAVEARARLSTLAALFDRVTCQHLAAIGVASRWRCLEAGAGSGSIARWLAERVGPDGDVLAADLDPRHVDGGGFPQLRVACHDLRTDHFTPDAFDLVHARLVLSHLPDPAGALARLVAAARPGGWIVIEDFEVLDPPFDPLPESVRALRLVTRSAADHRLGRLLPTLLRRVGLHDVDAEGRTLLLTAQNGGARLMQLSVEQLRDRLLATGAVSASTVETDLAAFAEPDFEMRSPVLWTAWGRKL